MGDTGLKELVWWCGGRVGGWLHTVILFMVKTLLTMITIKREFNRVFEQDLLSELQSSFREPLKKIL